MPLSVSASASASASLHNTTARESRHVGTDGEGAQHFYRPAHPYRSHSVPWGCQWFRPLARSVWLNWGYLPLPSELLEGIVQGIGGVWTGFCSLILTHSHLHLLVVWILISQWHCHSHDNPPDWLVSLNSWMLEMKDGSCGNTVFTRHEAKEECLHNRTTTSASGYHPKSD